MLHYARAMLGRKLVPAITVSIAPASQSLSGSVSSQTFNNEVITVTGGTPSSYTWGFISPTGGSWTINSGQGTASAAARVTTVVAGEVADATLYCDVVINGVTYRRTAQLTYSRA